MGQATYGIQAHPEVKLTDARNFPRDCWAAMLRHFGPEAETVEAGALAEIEAHYESGAAFCRLVSERWLRMVADGIAAREGPPRSKRRAASR